MADTFLLPDLGEGLTEAEIVRWLVTDDEVVAVDQPVVEVETAKSVVELPSPYAGRVASRHGAEGEVVAVGSPLLTVEAGGGSGNVLVGYGTTEVVSSARRRRPRASAVAAAPAASGVVRVISPLVRKLARDNGVDVSTLKSEGIVTRADVERAITPGFSAQGLSASASVAPDSSALGSSAPGSPSPGSPAQGSSALGSSALGSPSPGSPAPGSSAPGSSRIPMSGFRQAVSATLTRSRAEIPEATVWVDVDATELWRLREATRPGPGILAYLARFTVAALREFPVLNSRIEGNDIVQLHDINLGLAVQSDRGLVVPAVRAAQTMTTAGLDTAIREVTAAARTGKVTAAAEGTFTLTNYGGFNVDGSAAIITYPLVASLGLGRCIPRPWVGDGQIVVRKITQMSFVFDHRVCDGGTAAGFMRCVADAIENPASAIAHL